MRKTPKKGSTYFCFCFKQILKCYTCFFIRFSRAFQKYSFQICSFSHKKVMGYLLFFFPRKTRFFTKSPLLFIKSQGGALPACLGLIKTFCITTVWRKLTDVTIVNPTCQLLGSFVGNNSCLGEWPAMYGIQNVVLWRIF